MDRLVDALIVLGAEALGDDDTCSHGKTHKKAHQHIDDGGGGAHRRQSLGAHIAAHHDAVHRVVKLLEQIAQHQRQGEGHQMLPDGALGHIAGSFAGCGHGSSPLLKK